MARKKEFDGRVEVNLPAVTIDALHAIAVRHGITVSDALRRVIDQGIEADQASEVAA